MISEHLTHPAKDLLLAFGQGKLAADESSSVEQHLEVCRECCETLLDLKDDTFVGLVKIAQPSGERRMDALVRPADASSNTESDKDGRGKIAHPTDAATVLVQSGEPIATDELPVELRDHPRYRIVELIGRGGMGNVYRAEHRLMNRAVAIKLINSQLMRHPHAVERFRREVQAAAKLSHPNIVAAYDAEQAGNAHFLVMEFVEGTDLASVVKQRGPMSVVEACECIRQVAEGLQLAHESGMVHRDIKPHNLMLSAKGQVRILDFGLAGFASESVGQAFQPDPNELSTYKNDSVPERSGQAGKPDLHLTTIGSVMGTPDYIAPEQAVDAHSADIRADIYSLGCTLHFLLTGKPPFVADNLIAKLKAHAELVPESLTTLRGDVPQGLSNVVARMMAKKPAERFQTPAAVAEALAPFANPTASPPKRRVRTLVAALCMGVAALLAGVIFVQTSKGRVEIQSEVDDVEVVIKRGGEQIDFLDTTTGSQVKWLPSGEYEIKLKGDRNDIEIKGGVFKLSRWGKAIVTVNRKPEGNDLATAWMAGKLKVASLRKFDAKELTITQDGVTAVDGAWKIDATENRTARLFEVPNPGVEECVVLYRAKLKTENVKGRAFLEMWVRTPGGEFFSKGFQNAVTGTTGWSEYEIPFILQKGQRSDLVKLNVTIEGTGTVWIKDVELAKASAEVQSTNKPDWKGWAKDAPPPAIAPFDAEQAKRHQEVWAKHLGVPVEYTNSIGMKFALIPPGEFMIGSTPEEIAEALKIIGDAEDQHLQFARDCAKSEGPWHKVILTQPRYLGVHEVTQSQYEKIMRKNPSHFATTGQGKEAVVGLDTANHPVESVSWHEAVAFCAKLSQQENLPAGDRQLSDAKTRLSGYGYRLPTEAEWEFSCRSGTTTKYLSGDGDEQLDQTSWIGRNSDLRTHAVGELLANPFGLHDLQGNVWEWCQDLWALTYYSQFLEQPALDPTGPLPPSDEHGHVLRGGYWYGQPYQCRASFRHHIGSQFRDSSLGFRVSLDIEAVRKAIEKPAVKNAVLPAPTNLITDPSFENTGLTLLPRDWRAWTNENSDFRCEVVNGGHTGQRSLRISGKGIRGVVFGNDFKADRTKRYALKGWAKFEGDKDARAVIKFNYFRGSEFLGAHDLVGVTADQPGWHLFEKTDALDVYPLADHFYAMCHVEGNGSGWFDDLELIAYDRDKLPVDFDSRHGRHNRLTGQNSLERWVGAWETEYVFREFDNSPKETKLTMNTVSERMLGGYFLLSHAKAVPVASKDRKPPLADPPANAAAVGGEERLLFLTFDQNLGAFRQWFFSSNGKAFEWRGPWDDATKSLELRMLPDASNLFSTEHFVDAEHIEGKLRFQYVMGMKDAGGWTATRKAAIAKVDIPAAKSRAAEPAELALLDKLAGEWAIHGKSKPSVWRPEAAEERVTEQISWILGGKFLMARAFNEKGELTSIWIATYEPLEKSNHAWFFNADGSTGQWRVTWDAASRSFQWHSIDMPTGWTGTALNRLIDDDTFDNQATIKDENGRVMLDMTQDKRRKK